MAGDNDNGAAASLPTEHRQVVENRGGDGDDDNEGATAEHEIVFENQPHQENLKTDGVVQSPKEGTATIKDDEVGAPMTTTTTTMGEQDDDKKNDDAEIQEMTPTETPSFTSLDDDTTEGPNSSSPVATDPLPKTTTTTQATAGAESMIQEQQRGMLFLQRGPEQLHHELVGLLDQMEHDLEEQCHDLEYHAAAADDDAVASRSERGQSKATPPEEQPRGDPMIVDCDEKDEQQEQERPFSTIPLLLTIRRVWDKLELLLQKGRKRNQEQTLPHDTYSYMMLLPTTTGGGYCTLLTSTTLYYVVIVVGIQVLTLSLVLSDRLDSSNMEYNSLNIPADVDLPVRVAQCVALLIVVFTQDDTMIALGQLGDGYHRRLQEAFANDEMTMVKWLLSNVTRLLVGWLELFVAFLLVVQEESVIDIFLNFLAVSFVSEIDNMAHVLALQGFAGQQVQTMAERVQDTTYLPTARTRQTPCWQLHVRRFLMALVVALIMSAWGWVVRRQNTDYLLTPRLYLQFSDDFLPALGTFSGMYVRSSSREGNRVTYVEERSRKAVLGYCEDIQAWTFSFGDTELNPCRSYRARSVRTTTYDILSVVDLPWYDYDENLGDLPMVQSYFHSFDCRNDNVCGMHGSCRASSCVCDEGWFGIRCEFPVPCASIETDERRPSFLGTRLWSTKFDLLTDDFEIVEVYNRPVYTQQSDLDQVLDIIFFTGRRWIVTHSGLLGDFNPPRQGATGAVLKKQLSKYLKEDFHAYWSNYTVAFISEAVDVAKPKDAASPISLQWFYAEPSTPSSVGNKNAVAMPDESRRSLEATLICAVCDDATNRCFFDSVCGEDGVCRCTTGASGTLCQVPPLDNGRCNPFFNNPEFRYDGGDCCQATCRNSDSFFCGTSTTESGLLAFVGFSNCLDPSQTCDSSCWRPLITTPLQSSPTSHRQHTFLRNSQFMDVSGDGRTVAVHAGQPSRGFQVYSVERAEWIPQGSILGIRDSQAWWGSAVALSSNGLVVATADDDTVQVYEWSSGWIPRGQTLLQGEPDANFDIGSSLALNKDGNVLAVGFVSPGAVVVYDLEEDPDSDLNSNFAQYKWVQRGAPVQGRDNSRWWTSISLSDRNTIAIGTRSELKNTGLFDLTPETENIVQVFRWSSSSWVQLGPDILVPGLFFADFGSALSLSKDSRRLAIASPEEDQEILRSGAVRCYQWQDSENAWMQIGSTLYGWEENLQFGNTLAFSDDGMTLSVGTDPLSKTSSELRLFLWSEIDQDWEMVHSFDVGTGSVGKFAADASILAVSSMVDARDDVIETNLYQYLTPPKVCDDGDTLMKFSLLTDAGGSDISWKIVSANSTVLLENEEQYFDGRTTSVIHELCIPKDECTTLKIFDTGGDGLCCAQGEGSYVVWLDGTEVASGGEFQWYDEVRVGKCDEKCESGTSLFRMELMLDNQGSETKWSLTRSNETILELEGSYPDNVNGIDIEEVCLSTEECHVFTIEDTCMEGFVGLILNDPECGLGFDTESVPSAGYRLSFEGQEIGNSDGFILNREHNIGNCPKVCGEGWSLLRLLLRTDQAGHQTTWTITAQNGTSLLEGGPYDAFSMFADIAELCIDAANSCTTVTVFDSGGDGMFGTEWGVGGYQIEVDGESIKFGTSFGNSESTRIGNCVPTTTPSTAPSIQPTTMSPTTTVPTLVPTTISPAALVTSTPTESPTSPAPTSQCAVGQTYLSIDLSLDQYYGESSYQITVDGVTVVDQSFSQTGYYTGGICVTANACYVLIGRDSYGDGIGNGGYFAITVENERAVVWGFDFDFVGTASLGDCA